MTDYRRIRVSRPDQMQPGRLGEYHRFLLESVFPAVDELTDQGLIEGYDFLTHPDFDLRLWLTDSADTEHVQDVLEGHELPNDLEEAAPTETGEDRKALLTRLNLTAELTRILIMRDKMREELLYSEHFLLNQFGFSNIQEVRWHLQQAQGWLETVLESSGSGDAR